MHNLYAIIAQLIYNECTINAQLIYDKCKQFIYLMYTSVARDTKDSLGIMGNQLRAPLNPSIR